MQARVQETSANRTKAGGRAHIFHVRCRRCRRARPSRGLLCSASIGACCGSPRRGACRPRKACRTACHQAGRQAFDTAPRTLRRGARQYKTGGQTCSSKPGCAGSRWRPRWRTAGGARRTPSRARRCRGATGCPEACRRACRHLWLALQAGCRSGRICPCLSGWAAGGLAGAGLAARACWARRCSSCPASGPARARSPVRAAGPTSGRAGRQRQAARAGGALP